jgi:hypothetical protein
MKVILDTTVFGQGFNSRCANVHLLKNFLERTGAEVCIPAVVVEEAVNLVRKSIEEINTKLAATLRLTGNDQAYSKLNSHTGVAVYRKSLDSLIRDLHARVLPMPRVGHEELLMKALGPSKPFVSSGRGYRDALIWFCVLELAKSCDEKIAFISGNTDDWCQNKKDLQFHTDLVGDLKKYAIAIERVLFFPTLGDFIQDCAIETLPVSTPAESKGPPDYLQLLIDGKEWVATLLADLLPEFLQSIGRSNAHVEELEVVALSSPNEIRSSPVRIMDSERRLLQFSAEYRTSLTFIIRKSDLPIWSQQLSWHQREEWDENRLRVMTTIGIRAFFHMIERGESTEDLSIASISLSGDYKATYQGVDPIAVKFHQTEIHAPEYTTWRTVKCRTCGEQFGIGCHRLYPTDDEMACVAKLEEILAADHSAARVHENLYELMNPTSG